MSKKHVNDDAATLARTASDKAATTYTANASAEAEREPTSWKESAELPEGIERAFWAGVWWYKVGEHLYETLDRALEELKNR